MMLCVLRHAITKEAVHDLNLLSKLRGYTGTDLIEHDQLRNRRRQLLPLLPLYCKSVQILKQYQKKIKQASTIRPILSFSLHFLSLLDITVREIELLLHDE